MNEPELYRLRRENSELRSELDAANERAATFEILATHCSETDCTDKLSIDELDAKILQVKLDAATKELEPIRERHGTVTHMLADWDQLVCVLTAATTELEAATKVVEAARGLRNALDELPRDDGGTGMYPWPALDIALADYLAGES